MLSYWNYYEKNITWNKWSMANIKLFESKKIRSQWDADAEKWFFSIVDVIEVLTNSPRPRKYWNALKTKLKQEGSELSQNMGQLKMEAEDGKMRETDVADTEQLYHLKWKNYEIWMQNYEWLYKLQQPIHNS